LAASIGCLAAMLVFSKKLLKDIFMTKADYHRWNSILNVGAKATQKRRLAICHPNYVGHLRIDMAATKLYG
jgi:hypothetical protein